MCVFCDIVTGRIAAEIVHGDGDVVVFLDSRPLFDGHCLVVPRAHYETLEDLPGKLVEPYFSNVRLVAIAVERALGAAGTFVALNNRVSQSVPHLHTHVVPRRPKDGLRGFFWPRTRYESQEDMRASANLIREALEELAA